MKGDALAEAATAGLASACSKLSTYPFDLLKTKMATAETSQTLVEAANNVIKLDGVGGLYKGSGPRVFKSVTGKVLYFYIYRTLTNALVGDDNRALTTMENMVVGYFSEILELPIIMPLDAVATRSQLSKTPTSFLQVAKQLHAEQRLFNSWEAYVLGAMQPALQNTIFDQLKARISHKLSAAESFVLGVIAASISITVTYPLDYARTVSQAVTKTTTTRKHLSVVVVHNHEDEIVDSVECVKLAEKHGLIHVSTRELIDSLKESNCAWGKRAREEIQSKGSVSDQLIVDFTYERISTTTVEDGKRGFLLEGFPKTLSLSSEKGKIIMADVNDVKTTNTSKLLLLDREEEETTTSTEVVKRLGVVDILGGTIKQQGVAGVFKGLSANLVQGVLSAALMLMIKEKIAVVVARFVQRIRDLLASLLAAK